MVDYKAEINTDKDLPITDSRKQILAKARTEFINAINFRDFEIEHKIKVHEKLADGGKIDYNNGDEEFTLRSCSLKRKVDKDSGGFCYTLKIVVE